MTDIRHLLGRRYYPPYGGNNYCYPRYDPTCPVHLVAQLSSIVSTLYSYGAYQNGPFTVQNGGATFPATFPGYQTTATTSNSYSPGCPWNLITGLLGQILQYVSQMQASTSTTTAGNSIFPIYGVSPPPIGIGPTPGQYSGK